MKKEEIEKNKDKNLKEALFSRILKLEGFLQSENKQNSPEKQETSNGT